MQVTLEPLTVAHAAELWPAVQDPEMAKLWPRPWKSMADVASQITKLLRQQEAGTAEPFLVRADGVAVGSSSFYNIHETGLSIGWTFYAPEFRQSAVNTSVKLVLLSKAFDEMAMQRVQFDVDGRNERSRAAVLRLGATQEGILRKNRVLWDGFLRDTVVFSILADEWPAVRERLTNRLRRYQS